MAKKRVESSEKNLTSDTQAYSPADYDIGKSVYRHRYTERELALRGLAIRLGMTRDDMYRILGIR